MKTNLLFILVFIAFGCSVLNQQSKTVEGLTKEETISENVQQANSQIYSFLTFQKEDAEEAMNFYISLFDHSKIVDLTRWGTGAPGKEGTIMHASFILNGKQFMCSDSPAIHEWGFTPAVSNFVECSDETQIQMLFDKLSENGKVMMPLNNYGFSKKFGFIEDRFGVSWQLNLK